MTSFPIKLVVSSVALAFLFAMPADAQKARKDRPRAAASPAAVNAPQGTTLPTGPTSVWFGAEYLGQDPDPRIRHELARDLSAHFGGNF
jgi:hypothetical protein